MAADVGRLFGGHEVVLFGGHCLEADDVGDRAHVEDPAEKCGNSRVRRHLVHRALTLHYRTKE